MRARAITSAIQVSAERRIVGRWCALAMVGGLVAGCAPQRTQFEVVSFKSHSGLRTERFVECFEPGFFCHDPTGNWVLVFEVPGHEADGEDEAVGGLVKDAASASQFLRIEVFWRARPGTTFAESSQTNANILYCLSSASGTITYEGGGFVAFQESSSGGRITGRIESAALQPTRMIGEPPDLLGACRMSGTLLAARNRPAVVSREQGLNRLLSAAQPIRNPAAP